MCVETFGVLCVGDFFWRHFEDWQCFSAHFSSAFSEALVKTWPDILSRRTKSFHSCLLLGPMSTARTTGNLGLTDSTNAKVKKKEDFISWP